MASVTEHYERVLAAVYAWTAGGADAAITAGAAELDALDLGLPQGALAIDLGAGFGMHAIPLARRGARVVAIDSSAALLEQLKKLAADLPITMVQDDLLSFRRHVNEKAALILCMGDTLTHLSEHTHVDLLAQEASEALARGGRFVLTFRDFSEELRDEQRFIPVRSDERRILTCFLEYDDDTVLVHDILHEREGDAWQTHVSSYRKLRLSPERVVASLEAFGFEVQHDTGPRGMARLVARIL